MGEAAGVAVDVTIATAVVLAPVVRFQFNFAVHES